MPKCISYSLFGYGSERNKDSFDFNSYLRHLLINIRMNKLLYTDWETVVQIDEETQVSPFGELLSKLPIKFEVNKRESLTKMMLWRLKPLFTESHGDKYYSHVICRDLDSPATYRETQAVAQWIYNDKAAHAITDSISHTIPMMGGMIGFRPDMFTMLTGYTSFQQMFEGCSIDFRIKGADQDFLCRKIYPTFAQHGKDSITQHYVKGMPNTFLSDYHNSIPDYPIPFILDGNDLRDSNDVCGHIGSSGFYDIVMFNFLRKFKHRFTDLIDIEKQFPDVAYWVKDGTFE